uniref:VP1 n=1 Tax=Luscinia sibilans ambidensovirus TaxID=2794457 RepID=A0A8A4XCW4_9VIRU|nr:MAG: VP1 [Luscinia sibilans ambidensovirus]
MYDMIGGSPERGIYILEWGYRVYIGAALRAGVSMDLWEGPLGTWVPKNLEAVPLQPLGKSRTRPIIDEFRQPDRTFDEIIEDLRSQQRANDVRTVEEFRALNSGGRSSGVSQNEVQRQPTWNELNELSERHGTEIRHRGNARDFNDRRSSTSSTSSERSTTRLLGNSASTSATTAGAGGIPAGVGPIGAISGLAIGGIIANATHDRNEGVTLAGTDYVGPGNKIRIDAPRNEADAIAKEHDIGYQKLIDYAKTHHISESEFRARVEELDTLAYEQFDRDFYESGSWQSFVAHYGLRAKAAVERTFGSIYPTKPGKWFGKIYHPVRNLTGRLYTRVSEDTLLNSIILPLYDEAYRLTILFQNKRQRLQRHLRRLQNYLARNSR